MRSLTVDNGRLLTYTRRMTDSYPEPHEVVVVHKPITVGYPTERTWDRVTTVEIDGKALCLPKDGVVKVEADVGGAGYTVTVEVLATSVRWIREVVQPDPTPPPTE